MGSDPHQLTVGQDAMDAPARCYAAVTPHNSTDMTNYCRALYVGGAGDVVAVSLDGTAVTFAGVTAGTVLPIRARRVNSTDTTATSIVALW